MLQLDLANRSEYHILFSLKCSYHHERSSETIKVQNSVLAYIRPMQGMVPFIMIIKMFGMENITGVDCHM